MSISTEQIHKELELIQAIISKVSSNSFEVKKWLVGILTALIIFKNDELLGGNIRVIWLLGLPILCFWYLDAFFLSIEKFYREMYEWVITFRSQTDKYLYDLKTEKREYPQGTVIDLKKTKNSVLSSAFSRTVWPFYLLPITFIIIYIIIQYSKTCH